MDRFTLTKSDASSKKPWLVIDSAAPTYEDAVIYRFASRASAESFKLMIETEAKNNKPA